MYRIYITTNIIDRLTRPAQDSSLQYRHATPCSALARGGVKKLGRNGCQIEQLNRRGCHVKKFDRGGCQTN